VIQPEVKIIGLENIASRVGDWQANTPKALTNAIKTEGFSLRMTLMQAIRMNRIAPGVQLKELSIIARTLNRRKGFGLRQAKPLLRLASGVTYKADNAAGEMRVGFTARSPRWVRVAGERQQAGFTRPVTEKMRWFMAGQGARRLSSRSRRARRTGTPLMLRYSTRRFVIPPRPIIEPFWRHEERPSAERIRRNFRMIMAGQVAPGGVLHDVQEMIKW
jgi:hypothetical protein